jgi:hypothetical protein
MPIFKPNMELLRRITKGTTMSTNTTRADEAPEPSYIPDVIWIPRQTLQDGQGALYFGQAWANGDVQYQRVPQPVELPALDFICDRCGVQQHADGICANCGSSRIRNRARVSPVADARLDEIRERHGYRERQGLEGLSEQFVRAHQEIGYLLALIK